MGLRFFQLRMDDVMAKDQTKVVEELAQVKNVGEVRAKQLYEELNVRSIEELVELARAGELQKVSGIGATTEARIRASAEALLTSSEEADAEREEELAEAEGDVAPPEEGEGEGPGEDDASPTPEAASEPAALAEDVALAEEAAPPQRSRRERFLSALICPNCGNDAFHVRDTVISCTACRREYNFQEGVADLTPPYRSSGGASQRLMETRFYSRFYEDVMRPKLTSVVTERTLRQEYALSTELLDLEPGVRLLDVACGTGNFTRYFAQRLDALSQGAREDHLVVGVDLSWPMLETARKYVRRDGLEEDVFLVRGDATRLPLRRESFDRLHCAGALHMMDDIDEALRNFACVLAPGGVCVIGTFILGEGRLRRLAKRLAELPSGFHWFSRKELRARLEQAGFEFIEESVEGDAITVKARRV